MRRFLIFMAYVLAGIPAAAGVAFVARHAYATSDTPIDGAGSAFLYGTIALAAYGGPAAVIAVWANRWKMAAGVLALIVAATMVANISQTLGAIVSRNAGTAAERSKAEQQAQTDRSRLAQIDGELAKLPVSAVTQEAVTAAGNLVRSAEKTREAECARWRTPRCLQAEREEQERLTEFARLTSAKGSSDLRARLTSEAAGLRVKLERAPAVKERDPLGKALAQLFAVSEERASQLQLGIISAIFELVVASVLALPELLRSREPTKVAEAPTPPAPEVKEAPKPQPARPAAQSDTVGRFLLQRLPKEAGGAVSWGDIYKGYVAHCRAQGVEPLALPEFGKRLSELCKKASIQTQMRGGKAYCLNVRLVA